MTSTTIIDLERNDLVHALGAVSYTHLLSGHRDVGRVTAQG